MTPDLKQRFEDEIKTHKVVLFMKGNATFPACGFSARALHLLRQFGEVHTVDVLADDAVRQGIKELTGWPTIPQVFINGKFIGGSDIVAELAERGELEKMIKG